MITKIKAKIKRKLRRLASKIIYPINQKRKIIEDEKLKLHSNTIIKKYGYEKIELLGQGKDGLVYKVQKDKWGEPNHEDPDDPKKHMHPIKTIVGELTKVEVAKSEPQGGEQVSPQRPDHIVFRETALADNVKYIREGDDDNGKYSHESLQVDDHLPNHRNDIAELLDNAKTLERAKHGRDDKNDNDEFGAGCPRAAVELRVYVQVAERHVHYLTNVCIIGQVTRRTRLPNLHALVAERVEQA